MPRSLLGSHLPGLPAVLRTLGAIRAVLARIAARGPDAVHQGGVVFRHFV